LYFGPEGFCWMNTGSGCIPWFMYLGGAILIYLLTGIVCGGGDQYSSY
jgi:hypothetical protein